MSDFVIKNNCPVKCKGSSGNVEIPDSVTSIGGEGIPGLYKTDEITIPGRSNINRA